MTTWGDARSAATARLRGGADPASAVLDADVLLAFVLGVSKEILLAHPERQLSPDDAARLDGLVARRHEGEPVAYLRGWKEFYGLRFRVDQRVLIPRPETETLVDAARRAIAGRAAVVVDVGTGSGAIACAIAVHEPLVRVIAVDISSDAVAAAESNALALGVADRVEFREGDLLAPIRERVDVICANLPYLREDALRASAGDRTSLRYEPRGAVAAGDDGLDEIRRAIGDLPRVLATGGHALFECDPAQAAFIAELLRPLGTVSITKDLAGQERVVSLFARSGITNAAREPRGRKTFRPSKTAKETIVDKDKDVMEPKDKKSDSSSHSGSNSKSDSKSSSVDSQSQSEELEEEDEPS